MAKKQTPRSSRVLVKPEPVNYILEYWDKIQRGEIIVGKKIKQQYEHIVDDLNNPKDPYVFDIDRAMHPINFIEVLCKQAQGTKRGQPLNLQLFQKAKFQAMFGFVHKDTRMRQYREVLTIEGRKNGKTTENSALSLYMLAGDGEGAASCFFIATKKEQANIGFNEAYNMVRQSKTLRKRISKRVAGLTHDKSQSTITALASEKNKLDGLNAHFATIDELGAMKDRSVYDDMKQSTGAREQPMISSISTCGHVRDGIYDAQYDFATKVLNGDAEDRRFLAFIYELDKGDDWMDPTLWIKANPGLGTIKKFAELESFVEKAKHDIGFRNTVLTKEFNLVTTSTTAWLDADQITNDETYHLPDLGMRYGIAGFDLSETTDLTSACVLMRRPDDPKIYLKMMFWLPGNTILKRSEEDSIPYHLYEQQGILRASGDYKIDKRDVLKWLLEVQEEDDVYVPWIGYDKWHMDDPTLEEFKGHFGKDSMVVVRMGAQTLSDPMKEMAADLGANIFNYNKNELLRMCLGNTEIKVDENGNIQPVKGRDTRKRIDGTIAMLCAFTIYRAKKDDYLNMI